MYALPPGPPPPPSTPPLQQQQQSSPSPPSPPSKLHKTLFSFGTAAVSRFSAASVSHVPSECAPGALPLRPPSPGEQGRRWSPQRALLSQIKGGHRRFSMDALPTGIRPVRDLWQRYVHLSFM
ncbi:hypothetical protein PoB_006166000 [Plakobranchus ocellatus]|uniref:Uncharacterized protein n=1 Tax=Plakobranchus ocellatus TaxID=259542 RepID=A0AAV4CTH4_9GAST|nr:hypothetical protein PoB_006166000 [Plakobranchus ocellatus]